MVGTAGASNQVEAGHQVLARQVFIMAQGSDVALDVALHFHSTLIPSVFCGNSLGIHPTPNPKMNLEIQ